ncbi:MAG: type II toxin-antitoxin system VapC family toxin [Armatimonadetes bacterium]|nr:type II toxin-antitoxin system VapC family toxin [Armatimonadota bacterium]
MSAGHASVPSRLVLDAGPLVALLHRGDRDHVNARSGFQQLVGAGTRLMTPLPIVFEVYKWVVYEAGPASAQEGLHHMRRSLDITYPDQEDFKAASLLSVAIPRWTGTLEDAVVVVTALRLRTPVWTLNYRDLAAFPRLRFWTPN